MQKSLCLQQLLEKVIAQSSPEIKKDFVTSTKDSIRLVPAFEGKGVELVLLGENSNELQKFTVSEHAHSQIAAKLKVPVAHYFRLLVDHTDLTLTLVNALFEREPANRLIRVLNGEVRAFLSDRYKALDNDQILEQVLPIVLDPSIKTEVLSSDVNAHRLGLKVLFTGDDLAHTIAKANGKDRVIRPAFRLSNSETGGGALKIEAFFYDSYCTNGCVWGIDKAFEFKRTHVGGKLVSDAGLEVFSDATKKQEDELIVAQLTDAVKTISSPEAVAKLADTLRAAAATEFTKNPVQAVELAVKELPIREVEKDSILQTFLRDQDFSKFGLASAVTEVANNAEIASYDRANELEDLGGQILQLNAVQWNRYVNAEKIAA